MSNISQFIGGGGKLRYQEFLASGTFTPSAALLANGGQVHVEMAGGGGGGGSGDSGGGVTASGGGSSYWQGVVTVTAPVSVVVGAGGLKPTGNTGTGTQGGTTTFGSASVDGGYGGGPYASSCGGAGSGMGLPGGVSTWSVGTAAGGGFGGGGNGRPDGAPNSGGGGSGSFHYVTAGNGGSGFVRVYWYE